MKIATPIKAIFTIGTMLLLTACQQNFVLLDHENAVVGKFTLEIDANYPSPVRATLNDKEFSGDWKATKVYEAGLAKKYRLLGSTAYENYKAGNARDQLYQGRADLKAQDGTEMTCNLKYRATLVSGNCSIGSDVFKFSEKIT